MGMLKDKKSANPIRGLRRIRFWSKKWLVELVGSGPPLIAAIAGAFAVADQSSPWFFVLVVGCGWLFIASLLKIKQAYELDEAELVDNEHHGITACLHVLHATVQTQGTIEFAGAKQADLDLRVTFHRVVEPLDDPASLEQLVDYVGGEGGRKGRHINIQSGITGQAVRENNVFVMDRDVAEIAEYRKILVSEWHFRKSEAEKLKEDRFSAIAVPITSSKNGLVLGVVYLDTKVPNFFNKSKLQECVVTCCKGLSLYIGARYD